jgi:hypothetical protein
MITTARIALIALAGLAIASGPFAAPAAAQSMAATRASMNQSAVAQGPGGCQEFNAALAAAVQTQIRTGKQAEARRLAAMAVPCPRR